MKNIFKYLGLSLAVALMASFTGCEIAEENESADIGLGIKVFFPTKVVAGQPITINGSDLSKVTEIVFPNNVSTTSFELVSNEMIRVTTPGGIADEGGKLLVRAQGEEAEAPQTLTVGHPSISGYSREAGETVTGGEQITIYGKDLEFINSVEFLDEDGNPMVVTHENFYRKGTSTIIIIVPKKVFTGAFVGKVNTINGQTFDMPEYEYEAAVEGGHWETVKNVFWENPGAGAVSWNGTYRFGLDGHDGNNECITTFPQEIWDKIKTETFYMTFADTDPQIRVTTGWWSTTWTGGDIFMGNEKIIDNGDGTFSLEVNLTGDPIVDLIDDQHLLFTGDRYTPLNLYFSEDVWVGGGGHMEIVKTSIWKNEGSGAVSWNGTYRFGLDGHDGNNECITTFPQETWDKIKTGTFYMLFADGDPQIRVTTGWWSRTWTGDDIYMGNERILDNGDGTFSLEVNLTGDPIVDLIDDQHLLFTGDRYTPLELYFQEEVWVEEGGDNGPKEIDIASFTMYEDRSAFLEYPYFPSWGENSGKLRMMRGGDPAIETLGLTTSSKFIVYKEAGTTGQIQWNSPNWVDFNVGCNDWDGSAETIEVAITEDMLAWLNGEMTDGWSDTAIILQGDGLKVTKIVLVP